jgi:hypothetical protein
VEEFEEQREARGDVGENGTARGSEAECSGDVGAADGVVESECGGAFAFEDETFGGEEEGFGGGGADGRGLAGKSGLKGG